MVFFILFCLEEILSLNSCFVVFSNATLCNWEVQALTGKVRYSEMTNIILFWLLTLFPSYRGWLLFYLPGCSGSVWLRVFWRGKITINLCGSGNMPLPHNVLWPQGFFPYKWRWGSSPFICFGACDVVVGFLDGCFVTFLFIFTSIVSQFFAWTHCWLIFPGNRWFAGGINNQHVLWLC